jgi:hypothetical protein
MIDSKEATTEITLFNRKFKTPIFSGALSGMVDITEKPLAKIAAGCWMADYFDLKFLINLSS